ncbi:MAG: S8 family serine peptidase [Deltaproteobacteria bacterium]|nr:S8 family serine peptidase [Deltaproteobacteria bacterium]
MFERSRRGGLARGGRAARAESKRSRSPAWVWSLLALFATVLLPLFATAAEPSRDGAQRLIVRFRSEGAHALDECAETLFREGRRFESATADRSGSLDALHARVRVRGVRALFRRPDDRPLREQRESLESRIRRRMPRGARGLRGLERLPDLSHVYRVEVAEDVPLEEARALYSRDPHVVWVQRDHTHALNGLPNDPFLHSSGSWEQPYADLWGLHRIRAPEAWEISQGEGVIVAVVDTGVDYDHPDIAENIWLNAGEDVNGNGRVDAEDWNGVDDDGNGFVDDLRGYDFANSIDADGDGRWNGHDDIVDADPFDDHGHGTHVAGTIAAVAGNGIGIAGVAPRAKIMPLKGFPAEGPGVDSVLWQAVLYAAANGARVVNNSWSCLPECPQNPLAEEVVDLVHAMGVVIVTSAGNRQRDVVHNSPENTRKVVTVASSGADDLASESFSNTGWLLDVAAPGGGPLVPVSIRVARRNILSLRSSGNDRDHPFTLADDYVRWAGTSMASPHVAGVAALLLAQRPELDADGVRRILRQSAADLGPPGHDRHMGAGRLDALAALRVGPLPELAAAISGPRPGATFAPRAGAIAILGRASGGDLREWSLSFGRGNEPVEWLPIVSPTSAEVRDGVLADWDVRDEPVGTYVIRLDVYGREGHHYQEFLPLSLEHGRFEAVSSPGPEARAPNVAGRYVVWQSRRDPARTDGAVEDLNLFVRDLVTGDEHAIQTAPGDQHSAAISARPPLVSWLDDREESGVPHPYACALGRRNGACAEIALSSGPRVRIPPAIASGRALWIEEQEGVLELRACRIDGQRGICWPEDLGLAPGGKAFVTGDGKRIVWTDFAAGQRFGTCRLDPRSGACPATLTDPIAARSRGAVSGRLLAWVGFDFRGDQPLQICELDPVSGECAPVWIADGVGDLTPDLSGNRLVWDGHAGDEATDVFFCEYDFVRKRCPVQRLTANLGVQSESSIDGRRVVWEDDREGAVRIYSAILPSFAPIPDRRVREGAWLHVPVRVSGLTRGAGEPPRIEAEAVGERTLSELGIRFVDLGAGRGRLSWRPARGTAGRYAITFAATTPEQLVTRHTMSIQVAKPPALGRRPRWRDWLLAFIEPLRVR